MNKNVTIRQKEYQIYDHELTKLLGIPKDEEIIDVHLSTKIGGTIVLIKCNKKRTYEEDK